MSSTERFKVIFFVPPSHLDICKTAVFNAGAGQYPGQGQYAEVCFQVQETTQFRPGMSATPAIGRLGELQKVEEVRFETLRLGRGVMVDAMQALRRFVVCGGIVVGRPMLCRVHPYEETVYEVYKMESI